MPDNQNKCLKLTSQVDFFVRNNLPVSFLKLFKIFKPSKAKAISIIEPPQIFNVLTTFISNNDTHMYRNIKDLSESNKNSISIE